MIQAERLVECFEAEIWGGPGDLTVLRSVADAAMTQSCVPAVALAADAVARIRADLAAFTSTWRAMNPGETMRFDWPE
jgi:class 3 adenylate cyclase